MAEITHADGLGRAVVFDTGPRPESIRAIDVNGDQWVDLVVFAPDQGVIQTFLNSPSGFSAPVLTSFEGKKSLQDKPLEPLDGVFADFNQDGVLDVITLQYPSQIDLAVGRGDGSFMIRHTLFAGAWLSNPILGHFSEPDRREIFVINDDSGQMIPVICHIKETVDADCQPLVVPESVPLLDVTDIQARDVDGDGRDEIILVSEHMKRMQVLSLKSGQLELRQEFKLSRGAYKVGMNPPSKWIGVGHLRGPGTKLFSIRQGEVVDEDLTLNTPKGVALVVFSDFNRDEMEDALTINYQDSTVSLFHGKDGGNLFNSEPDWTIPLSGKPSDMVIGDFDRNGHMDVAILSFDGRNLTVFYRDEKSSR